MQTFSDWLDITHPKYQAKNLWNYKTEWLESCVTELAALAALESPPAPSEPAAIEFPEYPKRCTCGNFETGDDGFTCTNCAGLRF